MDAALTSGERVMTYRELNMRANGLARYLMDKGLRRGSRAVVRMEPSACLAVTLLAVLKAGGAYTWIDPADRDVRPVLLLFRDGGEGMHLVDVLERSDVERAAAAGSAPNLPVLTRPCDIACVLPQSNREPVLVPHATIVALREHLLPSHVRWSLEPVALDLWIPLMAGATLTLPTADAVAA